MQQPDIEIYVKGPTAEQIQAWLEAQFDALEVRKNSPTRQVYHATWQAHSFDIMVLAKVQDGYSSIWFDNPQLPWADDQACASQLFADLQKPVRCVKASWQEGDEPDQWLHIDVKGEQVINWA